MATVTRGLMVSEVISYAHMFTDVTFEWMFQQKSGRFNSATMTERDGRTGKHLAALGV